MVQDSVLSSISENGTFVGGDLVVASSVLMLVVVKLSTGKFSMESVGVFPVVAKACLALAATFRERNLSCFLRASCDVFF